MLVRRPRHHLGQTLADLEKKGRKGQTNVLFLRFSTLSEFVRVKQQNGPI
jgi:hypothetical protein